METARSRRPLAGLGLLALLAALLSARDARHDSATADEPIHLAAGLTESQSGVFAVNVEHPPLAKHLFGMAAQAAGASEHPRLDYRSFFGSARAYLFSPRQASPDRVLVAARLVTTAFLVLLLAAAYLVAGSGEPGLLAAALTLGNTALFPHGHLVTTDVPLTALLLLGAGAAGRFLALPSLPRGLLVAALLAAALATKHTAVILLCLLPVTFALMAWRRREQRRSLLAAAVLVPAAALLLLSLYLQAYVRREPPGTLQVLCRLYGLTEPDREALAGVERVAGRGLARWSLGLVFNLRQSQAGRPTWYLGEVTASPGASYHLVGILVKSPAPWLAVVLLGAAFALRRRDVPEGARLLLLAAGAFLIASLPGPRIGVRHAIPVLALASAGAASSLAPLLPRLSRLAGAGLLVAVLSPLALGRSLGAFNLVGRAFPAPPLADSNLDWGQDLLRLGDELAVRSISPSDLSIAYFGGDLPAARLPGVRDLLEADEPGPGSPRPRRWLAVSRQLLLTGPGSARILSEDAVGRAARTVDAARVARFSFRAGDSIDVYELGPSR